MTTIGEGRPSEFEANYSRVACFKKGTKRSGEIQNMRNDICTAMQLCRNSPNGLNRDLGLTKIQPCNWGIGWVELYDGEGSFSHVAALLSLALATQRLLQA